MNILLSNDDGIHAPGLWALAEELSHVARVTIVAPDREQSGVGTSVTFHHPLRLKKEASRVAGVDAYSVEGTPADSIILALRLPLMEQPDLVVSGINEGANLGDDVFISGTVGAALQGYFYGLSGLSVSVGAPQVTDFSGAARLARLLARHVKQSRLPGKILLNVNIPDVPVSEYQGLRVTRLAQRVYRDEIEEGGNGRRKHYWIARGNSEWSGKEDTDHWAVVRNYVSVTPLMASPVRPIMAALSRMADEVFSELRPSAVAR